MKAAMESPTGREPRSVFERLPTLGSLSARWHRWLHRLWAPPDPDLVHAGVHGEWAVAGVRLLMVVVLLYIPISRYFDGPFERGRQVMLWVAVAALAEALVVYSAVMRSWGRSWIGFFSGIIDVSLVTLTLWIYIRLNQPLTATNNLLIFPIYLLAIGATSLRYDWRICVLTGVTAFWQYLGLVSYAVWQWDLDDPTVAASAGFSWQIQGGRLTLLILATALATTLVLRSSELRKLSTRDRLTNLANRGLFDESLQRIAALASRSGDPVTVAMIDIDHFKRFNDTHGHLVGDVALREVAQTLSQSVRTTDLVARYGGEEFAALFPGMKIADAAWRLDELRAEIEQIRVPIDARGATSEVTVSIGAAVWPNDGLSLEGVLAIADVRLYQAKHDGRNRVVTTSEGGGPASSLARPKSGKHRPSGKVGERISTHELQTVDDRHHDR